MGQSVLQDWVTNLPLRAQGTLLTAVRGCDDVPKLPLDSTARQLTCSIRHTFMNPADVREVGIEPGAFFQENPPEDWKASELGHYPQHWYSHVMHAAEIIGYCHPDFAVRIKWRTIYYKMAHSLHLNHETQEEMMLRLTEDRIASGTVVS